MDVSPFSDFRKRVLLNGVAILHCGRRRAYDTDLFASSHHPALVNGQVQAARVITAPTSANTLRRNSVMLMWFDTAGLISLGSLVRVHPGARLPCWDGAGRIPESSSSFRLSMPSITHTERRCCCWDAHQQVMLGIGESVADKQCCCCQVCLTSPCSPWTSPSPLAVKYGWQFVKILPPHLAQGLLALRRHRNRSLSACQLPVCCPACPFDAAMCHKTPARRLVQTATV